jgi:hypothetical protein
MGLAVSEEDEGTLLLLVATIVVNLPLLAARYALVD